MTTLQAVVQQYLATNDNDCLAVLADLFDEEGEEEMAMWLRVFWEKVERSEQHWRGDATKKKYKQDIYYGLYDIKNQDFFCTVKDQLFCNFHKTALPADVSLLYAILYDRIMRNAFQPEDNEYRSFINWWLHKESKIIDTELKATLTAFLPQAGATESHPIWKRLRD